MYWPIGNIVLTPLVKLGIAAAIVAAVAGSGYYVYRNIYSDGYDKATLEGEIKLNDFKNSLRDKFTKQLETQAAVEAALRAQVQRAQEDKQNEIKAINERNQRIVDGLRNRSSRSDSRPAEIASPAAPANVGAGARCTGRELSREDGEFLAGEAARAEILKQALMECRRNYKALEEQIKQK